MKKSAIPKPKYDIGETVIFMVPSEGNYPPRRDVGKVSAVHITLTGSGHSIRYGFERSDDTFDESSISRRAIACQTN